MSDFETVESGKANDWRPWGLFDLNLLSNFKWVLLTNCLTELVIEWIDL